MKTHAISVGMYIPLYDEKQLILYIETKIHERVKCKDFREHYTLLGRHKCINIVTLKLRFGQMKTCASCTGMFIPLNVEKQLILYIMIEIHARVKCEYFREQHTL